MADDACRIDVWLWRARFCKTRALAARMVESGRVRLGRFNQQVRLDKPSRQIRPGDELVFAIGGRLAAVRVVAVGERRGPAVEARGLYETLPDETDTLEPITRDSTQAPGEGGGGKDGEPRH